MRTEKLMVWISFSLLVAALAITRYADFDLWWHLKLGQTLAETGSLFRTDSFSWTFAGKPQFTGEWLADLIIWFSHRLGGMEGVTALKALILLATLALLYGALRNRCRDSRTGFMSAMLTLVLVLFAVRFRMFVRPYLFSQLFLALYLYLFSRYESSRDERGLYLLPLFQALWSNLSVGAIFGPAVFFLFAVGSPDRQKKWRRNALLLAAIVLCSLLNPETWKIYALALDLSTDPFKQIVGEYQPLSAQILWGFGIRYTLQFQILALGALVWFVAFRGWKNLFHLLLFALFTVETVKQVRMIELSSLVAALYCVTPLERLLELIPEKLREGQRLASGALALLMLALIPLSVVGNTTYAFGTGIKEDAFPDGAIRFLEQERIGGRMFNSYSLGGYLIWRAPDRKVFIDGRYRRLYNPDFYRAYAQAIHDPQGWQALEKSWPVDYAVLEYDMKSKVFPLHLNDNPAWALVYWDNHSAVYLKRTPANQPVIERYGYRVTRPNFYDFSYLSQLTGSTGPAALLVEIGRDIARNPQNQEPRLARALLLYNTPGVDRNAVMAELVGVQKLKPDMAIKHSALAMLLYEKGEADAAREEVQKALALDPYDQAGQFLGAKMGMKLRKPPIGASPHP
jgi:hypothetical protein